MIRSLFYAVLRRLRPLFMGCIGLFLVVLFAQEFHAHTHFSTTDSCSICHIQNVLHSATLASGFTLLALCFQKRIIQTFVSECSVSFVLSFVQKRGPPVLSL